MDFAKHGPCCWFCLKPLAKIPGTKKHFSEEFITPAGAVVKVHVVCLKPAVAAHQTPHIWPAVEIRSETYKE